MKGKVHNNIHRVIGLDTVPHIQLYRKLFFKIGYQRFIRSWHGHSLGVSCFFMFVHRGKEITQIIRSWIDTGMGRKNKHQVSMGLWYSWWGSPE